MGRFYKTAKPTFVDDVIYEAPYELMLNALKTQDANFEQQQKELDAFDTMGDLLDFVDKDREARNERLDYYRGKADSLAEKINQNPALYQAYVADINRAQKEFQQDIKSGQLFEMDRNAKTRNKLVKEIQERKDISDEQKKVAIDQLDFQFQGTPNGGIYKDSMHIYEKLDEEAFIKNKKAEMTADSIKTTENRTDGRYFTTETGERRFITEEKLDKLFEGSTGVGKWEKALLQKLNWQVEQGIINEDERDNIYLNERRRFKNDFITSLGFEQKIDSTLLSRDDRDLREQENARAWGRYKKEMEELEETGRVIIERDEIPVPDSNLTEEDLDNKKYNESSEKLKTKIRERLKASGKFNTEVKNTGMGPHLQPDVTIVVDEEALNQAVEEENNRIRKTLALPLEERRDFTKELVETYGKDEVTNLLNFEANKTEEYNSETMTSAEKKTFKNQTYATIPSDFVGQVTMPDGTVKNMTRHEFEKTAEKLIPAKKTVETPITIKGEEFEGGEAGKVYAAYEASNGQILPIKTKDTKEPVLESNYNNNKIYASNQKQGIKKTQETVGITQPFDIRKMDVSTTSKIKYVNPLQTTKKDEKLNIHVQTSEGPMIWRIKKPVGNTFIQNK